MSSHSSAAGGSINDLKCWRRESIMASSEAAGSHELGALIVALK
jgi:hypothetical protein